MNLVKFLLLAPVVAFVPSEGAENRAATGLASKVAGLLRGGAKCLAPGDFCSEPSDCCSGYCGFNDEVGQPYCAGI
jgi:hypothetical protein